MLASLAPAALATVPVTALVMTALTVTALAVTALAILALGSLDGLRILAALAPITHGALLVLPHRVVIVHLPLRQHVREAFVRRLSQPVPLLSRLGWIPGVAIALDKLVLFLELLLQDRTDLRNLRLRQDQTLGERVDEGIQIGPRVLVLAKDCAGGEEQSHRRKNDSE